ncbi:uncharacterized protein G2W53_032743 [Senna tora]|uniref:Uncharacterized protein n=1 Tax=Senna tora TaxID=362788 RepID=A0A834SYV4_9FABA|nr:uncharacterized protein G2W53_032743 [Senna tora]
MSGEERHERGTSSTTGWNRKQKEVVQQDQPPIWQVSHPRSSIFSQNAQWMYP